MHPKKIVQSKLRHRLAKAAAELGLHYFLFHIAKTHKLTNIVNFLYSFLAKIKNYIEKERSPKQQISKVKGLMHKINVTKSKINV